MIELLEIIEKKHLKGNQAVKVGNSRFMPVGIDTNNVINPSMTSNIYFLSDEIDCHFLQSINPVNGIRPELNIIFESHLDEALCSILIDTIPPIEYEFASSLWNEFQKILDYGKKQPAIGFLYETLIDNLDNTSNCNSFLDYCISQSLILTSDTIVHILNALLSIKDKLDNWNDFKVYCKAQLLKTVGEKRTEQLMSVIK